MIQENLDKITAAILANQPYFDKGFAHAVVVENTQRDAVYVIDSKGEHKFVQLFDYNFFYIRANGDIPVSGSNTELILQPKFKLFACARKVYQYQFISCLASALKTFCNTVNITSFETRTSRILVEETKNKEAVMAILTRWEDRVAITIDFTLVETYSLVDVTRCNCNPCKPC